MSECFIGEIRLFAGSFAPNGWLDCNGALLPISQYDVLFNLIGTTYGGDGQSTFQLPNLQSRVPVHQGAPYVLGQAAGVESVTLSSAQLPAHTHPLLGTTQTATSSTPTGNLLAVPGSGEVYIADTPTVSLHASSVGPQGGSQPHDNRMPFQCLRYIIAWAGSYPSQN